jgi:hypothetical protein
MPPASFPRHSLARRALLLFALLLPLSACGGDAGGGTSTPSDSTLTTLSGSVDDYPFAFDTSVRAEAILDPRGHLASGAIQAGSLPRLTLALTPLAQVAAAELEPFGDQCDGATISDPTARGTAFSELEAFQGSTLVGTVVHGEGELDLDESRLSLNLYLYLLSDRPTRIGGRCSEEGIRLDIDLNLRRGWNAIRAQIDVVDDEEEPIRMTVSRLGSAASAPWRFTEEWAWPFARGTDEGPARGLAYLRGLPLFR